MVARYEKYDKYGLKYVVFPENQIENQKENQKGKIIRAFTTRHGGVSNGTLSTLNLSYSRGDKIENVKENYRRLAEALGLPYSNFIGCRQVHGTNVEIVTLEDVEKKTQFVCDGLITKEAGIVLVTVHADCTPVYIYDTQTPAVGMIHSGWKGTLGEIVAVAIEKMQKNFGSRPENIKIILGPCICGDCFEVREDVKLEFEEKLPWSREYIKIKDSEHWTIDLKGIIKNSLARQGIPMKNIYDSGICTMEKTDILFSHRGERGNTGTMAALISLVDGGEHEKNES